MSEAFCPPNLEELMLFLNPSKYEKLMERFPELDRIYLDTGLGLSEEGSRSLAKLGRAERVANEFHWYGNNYFNVVLGLRTHVSECPKCFKEYMDIVRDWTLLETLPERERGNSPNLKRIFEKIDGGLLRLFVNGL